MDSSVSSQKRLEGKVAIITGGASGIGAAAVRLFHENGAKVVIADVQDKQGQALANKLGEETVCYIHCDITNEGDIINVVNTTVTKFGKLDIMYNNAGIIDRSFGSIFDTTKSDLQRVLAVNTTGSFLGAKHAAKAMIPQGKGCILFTSSACTAIGGLSTPAYGVSKYGVLGMVRILAAELGEYGIRVNCVSPYAVITGISSLSFGSKASSIAERKLSEAGNLRGEVLKAEDVAKAALYLASDEANYVSGLNLVVDGGYNTVNPSFSKSFAAVKQISTMFNYIRSYFAR